MRHTHQFLPLKFLSRPHRISTRCYLHNPHLPNCAEIQLWSSLVVFVNNALGNLCFGAVGDDQQHVCSEWTDAMSSFLGLQMSVCGHWFKANSLFSLGALWSHIQYSSDGWWRRDGVWMASVVFPLPPDIYQPCFCQMTLLVRCRLLITYPSTGSMVAFSNSCTS